MKLKTNDIPVETGGLADQGEFTIKNSATAFAILSSGLYSNKFKAILRELGCNAYDSHVEAGYPEKPFTVHLPSRLNPVLSIRDYGIGLSHKDVMGLYTTYFESTKSNSNDFVGCMGLGSKSPFSYTKNFTITSIKDGTKGVYSAYIGKDGLPSIAQLTSDPTDESNGLEISFAVEDGYDMRNFKHEVADTFKWFQTKPEITGDTVTIPDIEYSEENIIDGVSLRDAGGYGYRDGGSYALMGNVAYPINVPDGEELNKGVRDLLHKNRFVLRFGIGDLDIAASREELGYTEQTIESLNKKAEEVFAALEVYAIEQIKPAKTKWERVILCNKLMQSNQELFGEIVKRYFEKNKAKFPKGTIEHWRNFSITVGLEEFEAIEGMRVTHKQLRKNYRASDTTLGQIKSEREIHPKKKNKPTNTPNDYWQVYNVAVGNTAIVFNNEKGNVLARIRAACNDSDYSDVFKGYEKVLVCSAQNKNTDKDAMLKFIKRRFPGAPIVLASQLPATVGTGVNGVANKSITIQQFATKRTNSWSNNGYTFHSLIGKVKDIDPTVTKGKKKVWLYLPLSHKSILMPALDSRGDTQTWSASDFRNVIDSNDIDRMAGINIDKVYGLNKTSIKTVTADKRWVNFFDYVRKQFDTVDWKTARAEAESRLIYAEYRDRDFKPTASHYPAIREIAKNKSAAGRLFSDYMTWRDNIKSGKVPKRVADAIKYDRVILGMGKLFSNEDFSKSSANLDVTNFGDKYAKLFEEFFKAYPMVKYAELTQTYRHHDDHWPNILDYIKMVDSA